MLHSSEESKGKTLLLLQENGLKQASELVCEESSLKEKV